MAANFQQIRTGEDENKSGLAIQQWLITETH